MLSQSSLRARLATLACVLTAIAAVTAVPASAQEPPPESPLGFSLEFAPFEKKHRNAAKAIRKDAMRAVVDEVNARWELPIAIPILFADALDAGPAYLSQLDVDLPDGRKITALINFPGPFLTSSSRTCASSSGTSRASRPARRSTPPCSSCWPTRSATR